ncbi:Uncharacterised protein [uncultured archaeon]|nr:Uncharacterised protein [uncultured archaeon]
MDVLFSASPPSSVTEVMPIFSMAEMLMRTEGCISTNSSMSSTIGKSAYGAAINM